MLISYINTIKKIFRKLRLLVTRYYKNALIKFASNKYKIKESYITAHPEIEWWSGHINSIVLDQYKNRLTGHVADFGCNHGACSIIAANSGWIERITGIDINHKAIKKAKALLLKSNIDMNVKNKVEFIQADFKKLPFGANYFDNAYCFHVLEHIYSEDLKYVIDEFQRVLKNGAHFVVTVPYDKAYDDGIQHVSFFKESSLRKLLSNQGFNVIECYRDQRADKYTAQNDCINALCINVK